MEKHTGKQTDHSAPRRLAVIPEKPNGQTQHLAFPWHLDGHCAEPSKLAGNTEHRSGRLHLKAPVAVQIMAVPTYGAGQQPRQTPTHEDGR